MYSTCSACVNYTSRLNYSIAFLFTEPPNNFSFWQKHYKHLLCNNKNNSRNIIIIIFLNISINNHTDFKSDLEIFFWQQKSRKSDLSRKNIMPGKFMVEPVSHLLQWSFYKIARISAPPDNRLVVLYTELYDYCIKEGFADKNLIAKWKKQGYENLCCLRCIQARDTNFGTNCICRVPKSKLEEVRS